GTLAARRFEDDIPETVKKRRLQEIIELQNRLSLESNRADVGQTFTVLIEGDSKKSSAQWVGRTSQNKVVVFDKNDSGLKKCDYVTVEITGCTQATLFGKITDREY
ncbi:MAG: TRAM domain-containing protein, partial [Dinghuibacter sp.]|nr:TRAM domain-containing protein [Dinghuibacter sp.]